MKDSTSAESRTTWEARTRTFWISKSVLSVAPAPDEAARGPQRHCRGGPGHPDAEEGPGHARGPQGRPVERPASAYNARPHETVHGAPEDVEKQPATEFRVLQDNADRFQHNKDLTNRRIKAVEDAGAFRAPTNAARSFNPQYGDVQQLRAVDSMTVRSTEGRETLLKLALPAPQGSGNAAGRLTRRGRPAAVRQLDDFLAAPRPRTVD